MRSLRIAAQVAGTLAAAVIGIGVAGCGAEKADPKADAQKTVVTIGARDVATVEQVSLESGVPISGTLEPFRLAEVKAQVSGTITGVRADAGAAVGNGQVLGTIVAEGIRSMANSAQAAIGATEANLALSRQRLESLRNLYETGAVSKLDVDNAALAVEAAQAQVTAAKANATGAGEQVARSVVHSPLSGHVSMRLVNDGEAVNPGQKLFTVVNNAVLKLAGKIPTAERGNVRVGQAVELRLSATPDKPIRGRVVRIEPVADLQTRQVGVHVEIDNPGGLIVAGQYAVGRIVADEGPSTAVVVPVVALRSDAKGDHVYVVTGNHVERRAVTAGVRDDARGIVAITSGAKIGEVVLTTATVDISPETEVRLVASTPQAEPAAGRAQ